MGELAADVESAAGQFFVVGEVAIGVERGAGGERHEDALRVVANVGFLGNHQVVIHDVGFGAGPLDVAVGGNVGYFGSESANDVALDPGEIAEAFVGLGNGFANGVGLGLDAFSRGVADIHDALGVVENELPAGSGLSAFAALVVAENTDHVAGLGGELHVPEGCVARRANGHRAAIDVERLVVAAGVIFVDQLIVGGVIAVGEGCVVEAHQLTLPFHNVGVDFRQVVDNDGVDL